jgi:hypothetical protein
VGIHEHRHNDDVYFLSKAQVTTVYIEIKQTQKAKLLEGKQARL